MRTLPTLFVSAAVLASCTDDPSQTDGTDSTSQAILDPYRVQAPLYTVTATVFVDQTANGTTLYYKDPTSGLSSYGHYDQLRASVQAFHKQDNVLLPVADPVTCVLGDNLFRGALDPDRVLLTQEGQHYSTCEASTEGRVEVIGRPLAVPLPVAMTVDPSDQLYLYTTLEILNPGNDIAPLTPDPNAGVPGGLRGIGGFFSAAGKILSIIPGVEALGGIVGTVGGVLSSTADVVQSATQEPPSSHCTVTKSLIPSFGPGQTPNDIASPIMRVQLSGREMWEKTAGGDAVLEYPLDWGDLPGTKLCQRPKTRVVYRIRRVVAENLPGEPVFNRAQQIDASYPDAFDSFIVDAKRNVIHDQWVPNTWSHLSDVPSKAYSGACGASGCYYGLFPVFPPRAHIAALAKAPGNQDIFAISAQGNLVSNWRNTAWDNNAWHDWSTHSGAYFPPGAPVAAVSRSPGHIDIFAIATDGSMMTTSWDSSSGWTADTTRLSATNTFTPYDGTTGGGLAARSEGTDLLTQHIVVYATGAGYFLNTVSWTLFGGWQLATDVGPPNIWYQPGGSFALLSRGQRTDLLFVDAYGHGRSIWYQNGVWSTQQLTPDTLPLVRGGDVAGVIRKTDVTQDEILDNDHMDFFSIGSNGKIVNAVWRAGQNSGQWFPATELQTVVGEPGAPIGAVSPYAGSIQVSARKADGTMAHTWYYGTEEAGVMWQTTPMP